MKKFLAILLAVFMVFSFAGCSNGGGGQNTPAGGDENTLDGTYDITVWVSELDGIKELTQKQIDAFMAENPGIVINATIEGISEADSATQMINDVESGADLYCFAQDQLARLVQAGALNVLGDATAATVKERNDDASIMASTVDGKIYCYPLTSDNGYFMYYDKSVISEDIVDSLEDLVAACEANNRQFSMEF
ncbi:MAG: extracellular solute-binding protein, partial [Firmicutes bacterium]|nr:extracellular solute-binding protein [Bacillota bacterium]